MLALFLVFSLAAPVEVERVLAAVNGVPVLASDVDLAQIGGLVPRSVDESDERYRVAVAEALVLLELRWQDLDSAGIAARQQADVEAAWNSVVKRAGSAEALRQRLAAVGLEEAQLRALVRRAAIVQSYVGARFSPFLRPTAQEVEKLWQDELRPQIVARGGPVPELKDVRAQVESILRERKLNDEVARWTHELETRSEVVRYFH